MIHGIDISHFSALSNDLIREMVREHELYFNYIKASEGMTIQDEKFEDFWKMSREAGLICGGYHFLRPLSDPVQQANNFLAQYKKVIREGVIPPAVDIEWTKTSNDSPEQWAQIPPSRRIMLIREFISKIEQDLNTISVIYTATNFWNEFIQSASSDDDNDFFSSRKLWLADPNGNGRLPAPWASRGASFTQIHFGEQANTLDTFDNTDQNIFSGKTLDFLNCIESDFTIMNGFPFSFIVRDIQDALIAQHFLNGNADGLFGDQTEQSVRNFQSSSGLAANGTVDAQTWNALFRLLA